MDSAITQSTTKGGASRTASATVLTIAVAALVLIVLGFTLMPFIENFYFEREKRDGAATLNIVANGLNQLTERYEPLPQLIAERSSLKAVLNEPGNQGLIPFVNEQLSQTSSAVGASDLYLIDKTGLTIAASNYRKELSFVGKRFDFRPYFQEAISGQNSQYHALGTTSHERGFFFATPLLDGIEVSGVVALKVVVNEIEDSWHGLNRTIAIADPNGIIFMSNREDWRFQTLNRLSAQTLDKIELTQQYPIESLGFLNFSQTVISEQSQDITLQNSSGDERFIASSVPLNLAGWHAIVFSPFEPVRTYTFVTLLVIGLIVSVIGLLILISVQRQQRQAERARNQQIQKARLEKRVQERTADLKQEVEERKLAEQKLRQTQNELIQAGKLAALGQMSAALSHEINQPLSAILTYADNARSFLARDRTKDVGGNIQKISEMADRITRISGHLRNFARRPGDTLNEIEINAVISEAIELFEPQLKSRGATIKRAEQNQEVVAMGGRLRLQQVMVNLFTNALDAMQDQDKPQIEVWIDDKDNEVQICVRDFGPGLNTQAIERAFEPFYSEKQGGEGMGLGLSISQNIVSDFGGKLSAENHEDGGALFSIILTKPETERP